MQYDIFPDAFMDSLRDRMIANDGRLPKDILQPGNGTSYEDKDAGFGCTDIHSTGFAKAYVKSWGRLALAIGWQVGALEYSGDREASVLLVNKKGSMFTLRSMTMYGGSADIGLKYHGGISDGTKRNMYNLIEGGSHQMLHRIEERLWYWVDKIPQPKPYKINEKYEEQKRYVLHKLRNVRKKNGLGAL